MSSVLPLPVRLPTDSLGRPVGVGTRVRWRGREYTIAGFRQGAGRFGCCAIDFAEPPHSDEVPDEVSIDRVEEP